MRGENLGGGVAWRSWEKLRETWRNSEKLGEDGRGSEGGGIVQKKLPMGLDSFL